MLRRKPLKYIIICGSTCSGIGKGITVSSIAACFKAAGYTVSCIKVDPYLNLDAGTMNPYEHGECYVLDDGGEVDLDLGNYERFLDIHLKKIHNVTTGKIYDKVLKAERKGSYLGKTVQIVPHITDAIKTWIYEVAKVPVNDSMTSPEICFVELGGTVGDLESSVYFEALRQLQSEVGHENSTIGLVSYVPQLGKDKEHKTKPAQHGLKELRSFGLQPDLIYCRSDDEMPEETIEKVASFAGLKRERVISLPNLKDVTQVPMLLHKKNILKILCERLKLDYKDPDMTFWEITSQKALTVKEKKESVLIAFVGKYIELADAYMSVFRAFDHAEVETGIKVNLVMVEASDLEAPKKEEAEFAKLQAAYEKGWDIVKKAKGIFVPGGFGYRGVFGKMKAIQYARENKIPFLGICYGFQLAVTEWARNVMKKNAITQEFLHEIQKEESHYRVVIYMPDQESDMLGGTMRLGSKVILIDDKDSLAYKIYGSGRCEERHRHRYEVDPDKVGALIDSGLRFTGSDEKRERMEFLEVKDHPFFFGCQAHPELKSRIGNPAPTYLAFLLAAAGKLEQRFKENGGFLNRPEEMKPELPIKETEKPALIESPSVKTDQPNSSEPKTNEETKE